MGFSYRNYEESEAVRRAREALNQNSEYNASEDVIRAREALREHEENRVDPWNGGAYGQALQDQIDKIKNRDPFSYDLASDALYQQYKDQYMTGGKYAMMDTMGQAAALTGGYGNSYAATAGNQAYQAYLQKLNDIAPQLYSLALDKYKQDVQSDKDLYNIYADRYGTEYGEYRDKVSDWNNEAARLSNEYWNEANFDYSKYADYRDYLNSVFNSERDYDYGVYSDEYARAFANYQQQVAEQQYWANYNLRAAQAAASSQSGYSEADMQKAANSTATRTFMSSIMTQNEFGKHGMQAGGVRYDNYTQYVNAILEQWYKNNQLTENEVAYLKGYYGI